MNNLTKLPGITLWKIMETLRITGSLAKIPTGCSTSLELHYQVSYLATECAKQWLEIEDRFFTWEVPVSGLKLSFLAISLRPGNCSKVVLNMSSYTLPSLSLTDFLPYVSINVSSRQ
jgi:hypothetical protein